MLHNYQRVVSIFLYILMAIGFIFAIIFYFGNVVPGTEGTSMQEPVITGKFLILSYIYFAIAALLTIAFPLIYMITHPSKVKGALISIIAFGGIVLIGYLLGSDAPLASNPDVGATTLKLVDSGLKISYILLALAFIGIIYSEVASVRR